MAGTALGMLILPQLVRILLEAFGFRGAVLLLSGMALHAVVGSTLLQPVKKHLIDAPSAVAAAPVTVDVEQPPFETAEAPSIKFDLIGGQPHVLREDDDDDLPELTNLIYVNSKKLRKNFSDVAISSMGRQQQMTAKKHPTLVRIMSAASNTGMLSGGGGGGADLGGSTSAVRKRRASVISHLSQLDFTGSNVQVHMNVSKPYINLLLDDKSLFLNFILMLFLTFLFFVVVARSFIIKSIDLFMKIFVLYDTKAHVVVRLQTRSAVAALARSVQIDIYFFANIKCACVRGDDFQNCVN